MQMQTSHEEGNDVIIHGGEGRDKKGKEALETTAAVAAAAAAVTSRA